MDKHLCYKSERITCKPGSKPLEWMVESTWKFESFRKFVSKLCFEIKFWLLNILRRGEQWIQTNGMFIVIGTWKVLLNCVVLWYNQDARFFSLPLPCMLNSYNLIIVFLIFSHIISKCPASSIHGSDSFYVDQKMASCNMKFCCTHSATEQFH